MLMLAALASPMCRSQQQLQPFCIHHRRTHLRTHTHKHTAARPPRLCCRRRQQQKQQQAAQHTHSALTRCSMLQYLLAHSPRRASASDRSGSSRRRQQQLARELAGLAFERSSVCAFARARRSRAAAASSETQANERTHERAAERSPPLPSWHSSCAILTQRGSLRRPAGWLAGDAVARRQWISQLCVCTELYHYKLCFEFGTYLYAVVAEF